MKKLTKAEEEVMQHLWTLGKAFVKELLEQMPEPKPAYNTVSTIVRVLEKKGFVGHEAFGKTHRYYPLVSKEDYSRQSLRSLVSDYFEGSYRNMVSFFVKQENLSLKELEGIQQFIEKQKDKK